MTTLEQAARELAEARRAMKESTDNSEIFAIMHRWFYSALAAYRAAEQQEKGDGSNHKAS